MPFNSYISTAFIFNISWTQFINKYSLLCRIFKVHQYFVSISDMFRKYMYKKNDMINVGLI